jgi:disulfide oxidoreductase YuzD
MERMEKRTAVEWLVEEIKSKYSDIDFYHIKKEIDLAKIMEKEQHEKSYNQGLQSNFQNFELYYNKTYNK